MRFLIKGRKRISGEELAPLEIEAPSELAARSEAMARGIKVESVDVLDGAQAGSEGAGGGFVQGGPEVAQARSDPALPARARAGAYEFSGKQEELIAGLARYMRIAGALSVLFGLLQLLVMLMGRGNAAVLVQGVFMLVLGGLAWSIGGRFKAIAETTGKDIETLMEALGGLKLMYGIQVWAAGIALVLMLLVLVLALLGALR